jgi:hypothetical protein
LTLGYGLNETTYAKGTGVFGQSSGDEQPSLGGLSFDITRVNRQKNESLPLAVYLDNFIYSSILGGSSSRVTGVGVLVRKETKDVYFGLGVGLYSTTIPDDVTFLEGSAIDNHKDTHIGGKVFVGFPVRSSVFLEFGFTGNLGLLSPGPHLAIGLRL